MNSLSYCLPGLKAQRMFLGFFELLASNGLWAKIDVLAGFVVVSCKLNLPSAVEANTSRCSVQPFSKLNCGHVTLSRLMSIRRCLFLLNRKTHKEKIAHFLCLTVIGWRWVKCLALRQPLRGNGIWERPGESEILTQNLDIAKSSKPTLDLLCEK